MAKENDQNKTLMNGTSLATTANFDFTIEDGVERGSIHIVTDSDFNGTTSTLALQASNDNSNWAIVYQDDNVTAMSFTLAASSNYSFLLKGVFYQFYRLVYTKGNASAGTAVANFRGSK